MSCKNSQLVSKIINRYVCWCKWNHFENDLQRVSFSTWDANLFVYFTILYNLNKKSFILLSLHICRNMYWTILMCSNLQTCRGCVDTPPIGRENSIAFFYKKFLSWCCCHHSINQQHTTMFSEITTTTLSVLLPTIAQSAPQLFMHMIYALDRCVAEQQQQEEQEQEQRIIARAMATAPHTAPAA